MNQNFKRILSLCVLLSTAAIMADCGTSNCDTSKSCSTCPTGCAQGQNLYQPHAFAVSASREIMLEQAAWTTMSDDEGWHGGVAFGFDFMQTFKNDCSGCCTSLGSLPFWAANNSATMTVGDTTSTTAKYDADAYQFGLGPVTTSGSITLNPKVYQTGADFLLYVGAHKTERGFFLKAHAPVGVTHVSSCLTQTGDLAAVAYPNGILNATSEETTVAAPYASMVEAFKGGKDAGFLKKMKYGLINGSHTSGAKFGDAEFTLGYNFYADEEKHFGAGIRFSAPTGNKAEGVHVLEPIFGRNGHWGLGGEVIGHWKFWESDSDDKWMQMFMQANVLHLFDSKHVRSFDLANNGAGSKYLWIAKFTTGSTGSFQNEIQNAINLTTTNVKSSFDIEGNFALSFDFHWKAWSFLVGYEGWGRTCEKIKLDCKCNKVDLSDYVVIGRQVPTGSTYQRETAIYICEPAANINKMQAAANEFSTTLVDATNAANHINADAATALDIDGQRARGVYSSKPFAEIRYTWIDTDYAPYLAVTGGAEFAHTHKNEAPRYWNVGLNGGIAF